jgi:hypothetical protein
MVCEPAAALDSSCPVKAGFATLGSRQDDLRSDVRTGAVVGMKTTRTGDGVRAASTSSYPAGEAVLPHLSLDFAAGHDEIYPHRIYGTRRLRRGDAGHGNGGRRNSLCEQLTLIELFQQLLPA